MKYTIIEDCSPYFIRFKWDGLPELIEFIKAQPREGGTSRLFTEYTHYNFDFVTAANILDKLPMRNDFDFMLDRVGLFIANPNQKVVVHKDGPDHRFSINMLIELYDTCCSTHWWTEDQFSEHEKWSNDYTRQIKRRNISLPDPAKSMTATMNECILFNTDFWHAWDNEKSTNQRILLTLRVNNPGKMYFDDAKKILFGNVAESGLLQQS